MDVAAGSAARDLNAEDVAGLFDVSPATIRLAAKRGILTHYKIGRSPRFRPADIEAVRQKDLPPIWPNRAKSKPEGRPVKQRKGGR